MFKNKKYQGVLAILGIFSCHGVASNEFDIESGNKFDFSLNSEVGTTDNYSHSNDNKHNTSYIKVSPKVFLQTDFEQSIVQFTSKFSHAVYQKFSQDNHSNIDLAPRYQFKFAANKSIYINGRYVEQHENRGTGLSLAEDDLSMPLDQYQIKQLGGGYLYGSKDSLARMVLAVGYQTSEYQTRRQLSKFLDRETTYIQPTFDYQLSADTYLAAELKYQQERFDNNSQQDKEKYTVLLGMKWQSTAATRLDVLLGYQSLRFNNSLLGDDNAFKWRVNLNWRLNSTWEMRLSSVSDFDESNRLQDSYRIVDIHQASLSKSLTDYLSMAVDIGIKNEEIMTALLTETEDYLYGQVSAVYKRNRWLSWYAKYQFNDFDSQVYNYQYQGNGFFIGFDVRL